MHDRTCTIGGCGGRHYGLGWCNKHYKRWRATGDPLSLRRPLHETLPQRLARGAPPGAPGECWPWTLGVDDDGYGVLEFEGKRLRAHRVAYELAHGPIADDLVVRHRCDNPPCCNPADLLAGTQADNVGDAIERGRWIHGPRHPRAVLATEQIAEIRALLADGLGPTAIGRRYGVSKTQIMRIRDGRSRVNG